MSAADAHGQPRAALPIVPLVPAVPLAPVVPVCEGDVCITCSDQATPVRVVRLLDGDLALVDTGAGPHEEVSVALVEARVGDTILVHAKEAIAVVRDGDGP